MQTRIECPECHGMGAIMAAFHARSFPCELCKESGTISLQTAEWREEGRRHREKRIERKIGLRQFALDHKMDAVILSQMERGVIEPQFPVTTLPS